MKRDRLNYFLNDIIERWINNNSIKIEVISQGEYTLPSIHKSYSIFARYTKALLVVGYKYLSRHENLV